MLTKEDIEKYFMAEKAESWIFMAIGIISIITAAIFFFVMKTPAYKGAAIPLLAVGLLLGTVGYTVYKRSDEDRIRNVYALTMNPGELKEKELPRMEVVMKNFMVYRYVEIALALLGMLLFFCCGGGQAHSFWKGVLAPGFFYSGFNNGHFCIIYCIVYSCFWKAFLWLGLSTNKLHGNDVSKS